MRHEADTRECTPIQFDGTVVEDMLQEAFLGDLHRPDFPERNVERVIGEPEPLLQSEDALVRYKETRRAYAEDLVEGRMMEEE